MFRSQIDKLHLSHNDDRTGLIGLSYGTCNIRDDARRGRHRLPRTTRYSRVW